MLRVYDVQIYMCLPADPADLVRLKTHLKTLAINAVGLGAEDYSSKGSDLCFSVYGEIGPILMEKMVQECAESTFPRAFVRLCERHG